MIKAWMFILSILLIAQSTFAQLSHRVIYGDDNRKDLYEVTDVDLIRKSRSTVAIIEMSDLIEQPDKSFKLKSSNYGKAYNLCPGEAFFDQQKAAFCSGSLIAEDLIMTAGHCVQTAYECSNTVFVFDFAYETKDTDPTVQPPENVYYCKELIKSNYTSTSDFAIIRLERKVTNRTPLDIRTKEKIEDDSELFVIGHPAGLPTKIADSGFVRSNTPAAYFVTNLDTYGGNSGSAVFNSTTGVVEGILVRGSSDYNKVGGCYLSNVCKEDGCRGEDVTRTMEVLPYLK